MTRKFPYATPPSKASASASASTSPCKRVGCTNTSSTPTTSAQADNPSLKFPTMEEFMAQPDLKIALEFGLITFIILFLHRHIGIEIEYFLWPIAIGLSGAIMIQGFLVFREDMQRELDRNAKKDAEKKEEKIKREVEEKEEKKMREERGAESELQLERFRLKYKGLG